jgi:hypothetical protein
MTGCHVCDRMFVMKLCLFYVLSKEKRRRKGDGTLLEDLPEKEGKPIVTR